MSKLKLGKGSGFVKRDLRRLPQTKDVWEADFLPLPLPRKGHSQEWLGIVVSRTSNLPLATRYCEMMPTVNDLASLLSNAMRRPVIEVEDRQRPKKIFLRDNPHWADLMPHLEQLGIEVSTAEELPLCEKEAADLLKKDTRKPSTVRKRKLPSIEAQYPTESEDRSLMEPKSLPCPFLAADNRCKIYEVRPADCVEYPHTDKDEFTFRTYGIADNSLVCPAVFYVVEQLRARGVKDRG